MAQTRGVTLEQEVREVDNTRDTRRPIQKLGGWLRKRSNLVSTVGAHALVAALTPGFADVALFSAAMFAWWGMSRSETAPLKLPIQSALLDPNEIHPGTGKPVKAQGIFLIGNESRTGKEVWLTNSDCRQHFLVLGTTGAGKTVALLGFAANAISWGSGFLFCDGKGDVNLFGQVYALCRRFGREDDLLVLNFMTGNQDLGASGGRLMSNSMNPFSTGSSDALTQMVVGLMDDAGGDGAMWKGRATAMFVGVMRALVWLRDQGFVDLNVAEIRDHLELKKIIDLGDVNKFPDMPQAIRKSVRSYLTSLPGFDESKGYKQGGTTLDQHGYLQMQFTKILGSLADVYGYIFNAPYGEVDMTDVVLNRRILVIMLPALEKAGDEIANLGRIVVATLKGMMGSTLGSSIEGNWDQIVENRPTNSSSPFLCILDEVGYYTVEGMALMAAQARSLGFGLVFASQDIPAMLRLNDKEAKSIIANTNLKVFMRTEEMEQTGKLATDTGGKSLRAQVSGYKGESGEFGRSYSDNMEARIEATERINTLDLKGQSEGEMHILYKDNLIRANSFYAAPDESLDKRKLKLRANHFIPVARPDRDDVENRNKIPEIVELLLNAKHRAQQKEDAREALAAAPTDDEIGALRRAAEEVVTFKLQPKNPIERTATIMALMLREQEAQTEAYAQEVQNARGGGHGGGGHMPTDLMSGERNYGAGRPKSRNQRTAIRDDAGSLDQPRELNSRVADVATTADRTKRPAAPAGLRSAPHGASVDGGPVAAMADKIGTTDHMMRALAALNHPVKTPKAEVDQRVEQALTHDDTHTSRAPVPTSAEMVRRADVSVRSAVGANSFSDTGGDGGDVPDFLSSLLEKNDDDAS